MPQYPQIKGHRNSDGGFDDSIFELQDEFLIGLYFELVLSIHLYVQSDRPVSTGGGVALTDELPLISTSDREATRMKRPIIHVDTLKVVLRAVKKAAGNAMIKLSGGGAIARGADLGLCVAPHPLLEN